MTATLSSPLAKDHPTGLRLHRFNVAEYHRLAEAGVLNNDEPIEMLEGYIVVNMDYGPPYEVPHGIPPDELLTDRRGDWPPVPLRKFTVNEYHRILEAGILPPQLRTELVEGWIVEKMTHGANHDSTLQRLVKSFQRRIGDWEVRVQSATIMDEGEPEPDIVIVPGPVGRYDDYHPRPSDIALVVEVSDTTLSFDRTSKLRTYARNLVVAYWIVNITNRQVEVYTSPTGPIEVPTYSAQKIYRPGDSIPLSLRDVHVSPVMVAEILPAVK